MSRELTSSRLAAARDNQCRGCAERPRPTRPHATSHRSRGWAPELVAVLAERLEGCDLTTLMLEAVRWRARSIAPADLLRRSRTDRFVAPRRSGASARRRISSFALPADVELVTLAPTCPTRNSFGDRARGPEQGLSRRSGSRRSRPRSLGYRHQRDCPPSRPWVAAPGTARDPLSRDCGHTDTASAVVMRTPAFRNWRSLGRDHKSPARRRQQDAALALHTGANHRQC